MLHCILKKTRLLFIRPLLCFGVVVVLSLLYNCSQPEEIKRLPAREKKENYLIEGPIFTVSYNEIFQQPNWITYQVRDIVKVADRGNRDFYEVDSVYTSNDADYYANHWDKGHMAPAAAFTDSVENLHETFSYLNCALQRDALNRGEWAYLETQVREWAKTFGTLEVRIDVLFDQGHEVLPTGAHIPTGFLKTITFPDNQQRCFYFSNEPPEQEWEEQEVDCSD